MFDQRITTKVFHENKYYSPLAMMYYEKLSDEDKKSIQRHFDVICEWYAESDNYKKDTKELDYIYCCEHFGHCGMSTGMIILIVFLVLGVLASGAAAFCFFL
ncbi:hypothetical protein CAEBREN_20577 [Caenorhabditis brenneri]|uniref:Uncharacterized protein n=1 Tax=Caenorhabditis brenneri TaxID=135651 RepID=G0MDK0_CAEBE|nr:hypothetical protein CAEBREN_20577 [Caenorhabditis brenneri]